MGLARVRAGSTEETCLANTTVSELRQRFLRDREQRRALHGLKEAYHAQQQLPRGLYRPQEVRDEGKKESKAGFDGDNTGVPYDSAAAANFHSTNLVVLVPRLDPIALTRCELGESPH